MNLVEHTHDADLTASQRLAQEAPNKNIPPDAASELLSIAHQDSLGFTFESRTGDMKSFQIKIMSHGQSRFWSPSNSTTDSSYHRILDFASQKNIEHIVTPINLDQVKSYVTVSFPAQAEAIFRDPYLYQVSTEGFSQIFWRQNMARFKIFSFRQDAGVQLFDLAQELILVDRGYIRAFKVKGGFMFEEIEKLIIEGANDRLQEKKDESTAKNWVGRAIDVLQEKEMVA